MGQLAEYLKQEEQHRQTEFPNREHDAEEWKSALTQLFDQLESWIREADPQGRMLVSRDTVRRFEMKLGYCDLPRLKVSYEGVEVNFQPSGRFCLLLKIEDPAGRTRDADGSVRIESPHPIDYALARIADGEVSRWYLASHPQRFVRQQYREFTREESEALLVVLLK